jgi:hypothetical protein
MTPDEKLAIVRQYLDGTLTERDAAEQLAIEPLGFNLSLVELPEADREKVAELFRAAFMLVALRSGGPV